MSTNQKEHFNSNRISIWTLKSSLLLGLPLFLLYLYNYSAIEIEFKGIHLKKIDQDENFIFSDVNQNRLKVDKNYPQLNSLQPIINESNIGQFSIIDKPVSASQIEIKDSLNSTTNFFHAPVQDSTLEASNYFFNQKIEKSDTSTQRILLIGDSQAGGLVFTLNDYCSANGHKLLAAFAWNSASTFNFGYSSKVDSLIIKYRPTLIIVVLGLNELYARDLKERAKAANLLRAKFGEIPYLWIGPANFVEDFGINQVYQQIATPERFFLSKYLNLPKALDHRHPNAQGYKIWMEYIASFIQHSDKYNFKFDSPLKTGYRLTARIFNANAVSDRGY